MLHQGKKRKSFGLILIICAVLCGVTITGIYLTKLSLPTPQKTTCQYDANVCDFLHKVQDPKKYYAGPFTVSMTTTSNKQKTTRVIMRSDGNQKTDIIFYDGNKFTGESIIIDNTMYVKDIKTNTWSISAKSPDVTLLSLKKKSLDAVNKSGNEVSYTFIGNNPCAKKTCFTYQLKTPTNGSTKTYVLFTQNTHMLKEVITKTADNTTIATLFIYGSVDITPPPVK